MKRRHGAELEDAIRSAVLDLLADGGPAGVTMEAVATRAQTSKPVLYRRWPDRSTLLRDTLLHATTASIPHADEGSYRADMLAVLRGTASIVSGPNAALLRAVITAGANDPELTAAFRTDVVGWRKKEMIALLERGIARGDVRRDVPVDLACELGPSMLWFRLLVTGDPIDDELIVTLVDEVLVPLASPRP